jgi:chaperone BCS1
MLFIMNLSSPILVFFITIIVFLVLRFLSKTSFLHILARCWRSFEDKFCVYQIFKVPQFNDLFQDNQLFNKVSTYLTSLPAIEDSDFTNLFSGSKANDIILHLDKNQVIHDSFLGARVQWSNEKYCEGNNGKRTLVLKLRKKDKRTILRPYLQNILSVADQIKQKNEEIKLFMNLEKNPYESGRWTSVPFTHPATMDTMVMDGELKSKVKADLELFLKSKQYYHRLGHVWKRSYLLYGASGTGKSSFIAAMARFLSFDVYDIDISKVSDDSDLKMLLLQTTSRSMIVIEDLDRLLMEKSKDVSLSGVLNFMDGIVSCCGEERVMVFTMNSKDQIDQSVLRPGRVDVHIQFPLCDFSAFKSLANNYLGVKEHKLFSLVEEILQGGSSLTPAEIGEIMISNRNSPSRALRLVISALQFQTSSGDARRASKVGQGMSESGSARSSRDETGETGGVFCQESGAHTVKELKKLYGLLRMGSRRKESVDLSSSAEKQGSHQEA